MRVQPQTIFVYVGGYGPDGIHRLYLDGETGELEAVGTTGGVVHPSFLAVHPNGRFLYAVSEVGNSGGKPGGGVCAFAVDPATGDLAFLNQQPSLGASPCHLVVDGSGRSVLAANYSGGSVAVLPIGEDGRLGEPTAFIQHQGSGPNPKRQEAPHAHSINLDPGERFALVADLGLDRVLVYRFDPGAGTLEPAGECELAPGAGPRHLSFHPDPTIAYVINELDSTLTLLRFDPESGRLEPRQTVATLPDSFNGDSTTAEVQVSQDGRFVYGSNRGHDSIAVFRVVDDEGRLELAGHFPARGRCPRNFRVDPTGRWLIAANQDSDNLVVFRMDPETGALEPVGDRFPVPMPACVKMIRPQAAS